MDFLMECSQKVASASIFSMRAFRRAAYAIEFRYYLYLILSVAVILLVKFISKSIINWHMFKFSKRMLSGCDAAKAVLTYNSVFGVSVIPTMGEMSDHYSSKNFQIRLSENIYQTSSIAAISIACHEAGHAVQYSKGSIILKAREVVNSILDVSSLIFIFLIGIGIIFDIHRLEYYFLYYGIIVVSLSTLFKVLTLPVEFDASKKAMEAMRSANILNEEELRMARKVLTACAFTYILSTLVMLIYLIKLIAVARKMDE